MKTAKAIAENIGLLPRDAPADKAVDCEIIRVSGLQNLSRTVMQAFTQFMYAYYLILIYVAAACDPN